MRARAPFLAVLLLCAPIALQAVLCAENAPEKPGVSADALRQAEFLFAACESNAARFTSGRGRATWKTQENQAGKTNVQKISVVFSFSDGKLRWDTTTEQTIVNDQPFEAGKDGLTLPLEKCAYNGKAHLHYLEYKYPPRDEASVYIRSPDSRTGGEVTGNRVDLKAMMEPMGFGFARLRDAMNRAPGAIMQVDIERVVNTEDGLATVAARTVDPRTGAIVSDYLMFFDPRQGYSLVEEQQLKDGKMLMSCKRRMKKYDSGWFIDGWELTAEVLNVQAEVQEFTPNVNVPDTEFELEGFGLPANTRVWDTVTGLDYKWKPKEILETVTNDITPPDPAARPPAANANPAPRPTPPPPDQTPPPPAKSKTVYILIAVVILAAIGAVCWIVARHPRPK